MKNFNKAIKQSYNFNFKSIRAFIQDDKFYYRNFYYHKAYVSSDTGLFFNIKGRVQNFLSFDNSNDELKSISPNNPVVGKYNFFFSKLETQYQRNF